MTAPEAAPRTAIVEQLGKYRAYHGDPRNVATHALGIPLIVLAVEILLSRPQVIASGVSLTPAMALSALAALYYLRLDLRFGLAMSAVLAPLVWAGLLVARETTGLWLGAGIGLFVVGWVFQFVGHYFEGRKPAFVDDLRSLLVGPLFVLAEAVFALGWRTELREAVENRANRPQGAT